MKKMRLILAALALLAVTNAVNAQQAKATLTDDGAVLLKSNEPLQSEYTLDASSFNFQTKQDAIAYFADKQSKYVSYRPIFHNNVIMVYLQTKTKPEWNKSDWNAYLAKNKIKAEAASPAIQTTK